MKSIYYRYFISHLSLESALFIKRLRLDNHLSFVYIYEIAIVIYSELKIPPAMLPHLEAGLGHTLCSAAMYFLDNTDLIDEWNL